MSNVEEETTYDDKGWHATMLLELGVSPDTVAEHGADVDHHAVARLIRGGCPPDLAVEIIR